MNDLSPLDTVTSTRLLIDGGAMVGAPRRGARREWTTREVAIIDAEFPGGGINACLPLLPGRSAGAIYQKAAQEGLRKRNRAGGVTERQRYKATPQIDAAIAGAFSGERTPTEAIRSLSRATGRPRAWLNRRARDLGLVVPRFKEPPWNEAEVELLRDLGPRHPDTIRRKLLAAGHRRTSTAIRLKQKQLRILRGIDEDGSYSATALGEIMGVDRDTVRRWVERGWLAGARLRSFAAPEGRAPHGRAMWQFTRREVRDFIVENVAIVDLRKIDKFWLVDLLAGGMGTAVGVAR